MYPDISKDLLDKLQQIFKVLGWQTLHVRKREMETWEKWEWFHFIFNSIFYFLSIYQKPKIVKGCKGTDLHF